MPPSRPAPGDLFRPCDGSPFRKFGAPAPERSHAGRQRDDARPSAYSDPARWTSISAASSSNRLYACAASIIAPDCAG
jgi:hypothetical protein